MNGAIASQKCWNHSAREAVARCPVCGHAYCRECVVEHEDRVICAGCLTRLTSPAQQKSRRWTFDSVVRLSGAVLGLFVAWFVFFSVGRMLLSVPDHFHADTIWKRALSESMREDEP